MLVATASVMAREVMVAPVRASMLPPALESAMLSSWPTNCLRKFTPTSPVLAALAPRPEVSECSMTEMPVHL